MRLHEFEAKEVFGAAGIAVPRGEVAHDGEQAERIAARLGGETVVKAQVLAGGRGKAGGIVVADSPAAARAVAGEILAHTIRGLRPAGVLVEEKLEAAQELYLGVVVDPEAGCPAVLLSAAGGVDVEEGSVSGAIATLRVSPHAGLSRESSLRLAGEAGLDAGVADSVAETLYRLYGVFASHDALIAEINPLMVSAGNDLGAADAVLEIDDAALPGHPRWSSVARSRGDAAGGTGGMTFVPLNRKEGEREDGEREEDDIGLICSGAGLCMATMDLVSRCARPANFLETGGGITRELMAEAMRRVLALPRIGGILINIYGGINPIHEGALGVAEVMAEEVAVPVVAKALGNRQEETWETLEKAGVTVVREVSTEAAVEELMRRVAGNGASGAREGLR